MTKSDVLHPWTRVEDLVGVLKRRWGTGRYLAAYMAGAEWMPITLPVKGPNANDLLDHFDDVARWLSVFQNESSYRNGDNKFTVEYRSVKSRTFGVNQIPARVRIDTFDQLCRLLDTASDVTAIDHIASDTKAQIPELLEWVMDHPMVAIANQAIWSDLLAAVTATVNNAGAQYLRHLDLEGIDTKFIEVNQKVLRSLLTFVLPEDRIDLTSNKFARRFGFLAKPTYVRFRLLSPLDMFPSPISELTLRADEFAQLELPVSTVFIVENEASYLAFPEMPNAIVIFGAGFALESVKSLTWLDNKELIYWGDIDTHGFVMLGRMRARFSHVRSILMDTETLLAHRQHWVTESVPTNAFVEHLTAPEAALYRELVEDHYATNVRLEQERVRFSMLNAALQLIDKA